jgi:D-methionine transport system ATP-binding protein
MYVMVSDAADPGSGAQQADTRQREPIVRIRDIRRRYGRVVALDGVSIEVGRGEIFGIIGRSGAGKSTLIRTINGLETVDEGSVEVAGQRISGLSENELVPVRRRIGMVFQHFNLLSAKTVFDNVALPLKLAGVRRAEIEPKVRQLLDLVGLADKAQVYPAVLSGGQKQRVGIARALAADPDLLLSDEATSALDPETTLSILHLLRDINRRLGLTIILITHEMAVIREICDRVAVLDRGRVVEQGPVWEVFARPGSEVTRRLLGTLRPDLPAFLAERVRPEPGPGTDALIRLDFTGRAALEPVLADLARELDVRATLVHGSIDYIAERPVATLVISVPYEGEDWLRRVSAHLAGRVAGMEVLGYVPRTL